MDGKGIRDQTRRSSPRPFGSPENIFITKEGRAKILDFGIAKQLPGLLFFRNVRMTPDAKVFAMSYVRKLSDLFLVNGVK